MAGISAVAAFTLLKGSASAASAKIPHVDCLSAINAIRPTKSDCIVFQNCIVGMLGELSQRSGVHAVPDSCCCTHKQAYQLVLFLVEWHLCRMAIRS